MRAVVQRVNSGSVAVNDKVVASIMAGLVIFLGVQKGDTADSACCLAQKVLKLRIFNDAKRKMNLCAEEINAQLLVVSQFTLCADTSSGRRPNFDQAQEPQQAEKLYQEFIHCLKKSKLRVEQGIFKEYMTVHIDNDGPVTFILETQ